MVSGGEQSWTTAGGGGVQRPRGSIGLVCLEKSRNRVAAVEGRKGGMVGAGGDIAGAEA